MHKGGGFNPKTLPLRTPLVWQGMPLKHIFAQSDAKQLRRSHMQPGLMLL